MIENNIDEKKKIKKEDEEERSMGLRKKATSWIL